MTARRVALILLMSIATPALTAQAGAPQPDESPADPAHRGPRPDRRRARRDRLGAGLVDRAAVRGAARARTSRRRSAPRCCCSTTTTHLYVGVPRLRPGAAAIRAHLTDRDDAYATTGSASSSTPSTTSGATTSSLVNPLGVQMDHIETWPGDGRDLGRDLGLGRRRSTAGARPSRCAIPFSTLRFQRTDGPQMWGFDAIRGYPRRHHRTRWAPSRATATTTATSARRSRSRASPGVSPGRNLEIVPTVTATAHRRARGRATRRSSPRATRDRARASRRAGASPRT